MMRLSRKLLKDMSIDELSAESHWHAKQAAGLLKQVRALREKAVAVEKAETAEILRAAADLEVEAEAHIHQSNLIDALHASRPSDEGIGIVVHAAAP